MKVRYGKRLPDGTMVDGVRELRRGENPDAHRSRTTRQDAVQRVKKMLRERQKANR